MFQWKYISWCFVLFCFVFQNCIFIVVDKLTFSFYATLVSIIHRLQLSAITEMRRDLVHTNFLLTSLARSVRRKYQTEVLAVRPRSDIFSVQTEQARLIRSLLYGSFFWRQEAKCDTEILGNNRPKSTLTELRLICIYIKKICSIKTTAELSHFWNIIKDKWGKIGYSNVRHVVFTVQNRLLHSAETSQIPVRRKLRVMFRDTSKYILYRMSWFSSSPIQKVSEFSEAGVLFTLKSQCPVIAGNSSGRSLQVLAVFS